MQFAANEFEDPGAPLSDAELAKVEQKIGPLPGDLKALYRVANGGTPLRTYFEGDDEGEYEIDTFLSMLNRAHKDEPTLEEYYETYVNQQKRLPADKIPFATDSGGNLYCIDRDSQKVYFWAHDEEDAEPELIMSCLIDVFDYLEFEEDFYE